MKLLLLEVNQYCYLDSLKKFEVRNLQGNAAKVLQMKWEEEPSVLSKTIYSVYKLQVSSLDKTKGLTLEEKKLKLVEWVEEVKKKHPERFGVIGWYDLSKVVVEGE